MRLFYFNPNNYGEEAFVMAETLEAAKEALRRAPSPGRGSEFHKAYHQEKIGKMINLKDGYTVDEYGEGEVVFSELA